MNFPSGEYSSNQRWKFKALTGEMLYDIGGRVFIINHSFFDFNCVRQTVPNQSSREYGEIEFGSKTNCTDKDASSIDTYCHFLSGFTCKQ